ncbi:hypothetical protein C8Q80DRAFT_416196 [Daedaleopsis nitida]|nr:hypothetical protein C8Q80DRAFT_416196 [Daedaleopsis nitida]
MWGKEDRARGRCASRASVDGLGSRPGLVPSLVLRAAIRRPTLQVSPRSPHPLLYRPTARPAMHPASCFLHHPLAGKRFINVRSRPPPVLYFLPTRPRTREPDYSPLPAQSSSRARTRPHAPQTSPSPLHRPRVSPPPKHPSRPNKLATTCCVRGVGLCATRFVNGPIVFGTCVRTPR